MPFSKKDYQIIAKEICYQGFYRLLRYQVRHKKFVGDWSGTFTREVFETRPAVAILPYDPANDQVILIEQFRVGALKQKTPWMTELVSGLIAPREKPLNAAKRESIEEAGCRIKAAELICDYLVSPGNSMEYLYLYCGWTEAHTASTIGGLPEENEDIRVLTLSTKEAFKRLKKGQIKVAHTIIALQWLQSHQTRLKKIWQKQ